MKRIHVLEWEDLPWFPARWRNFGTSFLRFIATTFHIYKPVVPLLHAALQTSGQTRWVDLASGGGSGLIRLAQDLKPAHPGLTITLTDLYPDLTAFQRVVAAEPDLFAYEAGPVDAANLPPVLQGSFLTLFGAFHHFRPEQARRILQSAVDTGATIAVFEPVGRNAASFLSMFITPLNVLVFTPFIRPLPWQVLPFVYLIPLIPLYILWDGIASIFRTYSAPELRSLVASLNQTSTYRWEIGQTDGPMPVHYLTGVKRKHPHALD